MCEEAEIETGPKIEKSFAPESFVVQGRVP